MYILHLAQKKTEQLRYLLNRLVDFGDILPWWRILALYNLTAVQKFKLKKIQDGSQPAASSLTRSSAMAEGRAKRLSV